MMDENTRYNRENYLLDEDRDAVADVWAAREDQARAAWNEEEAAYCREMHWRAIDATSCYADNRLLAIYA